MSEALPASSAVPPLSTDVERGRTLLANDDAGLEWNGSTVRFFHRRDGAVFFDVPPSEITHVRVDQGAAITFKIGSTKYHATFPGQAAVLVQNAGNPFPGQALARTHDMVESSPAKAWIETLRALGVRVHDNSFAPDPWKVIKWTVGIMLGIAAVAAVVIFIVLVVMVIMSY